MNVNQKGNIGLIKVIVDLYSKNFHCFTPFDDYSPIDCIAMNAVGEVFRLQVKYRSLSNRGSYEIAAKSVVNGKRVMIDKSLIDYWAVYLADIDRVVYLHADVMKTKGVHYITTDQINNDGILESIPSNVSCNRIG
jgi:hypothetical protein